MVTRGEAIQRLSELTERQREVLRLVCEGLDYKSVGEELVIAVGTVKTHMANVYRKLNLVELEGAARRKELFQVFCPLLQQGVLPPAPPEPAVAEPVLDDVLRMVEEDEYALTVWQPGALARVEEHRKPPPPIRARPKRLRWFLLGMVVESLLLLGVIYMLGVAGLSPGARVAQGPPIVETVEVTVVQTHEVIREVAQVITATSESTGPTFTPVVQTQVVIVTATSEPLAPTETSEVGTPSAESSPMQTPTPSSLFPFFDDFNAGLRAEWDIRSGEPFIGNGRLGTATNQLTLAIGDDTLTAYTVNFDYWNLINNVLSMTVAPRLQYERHRYFANWNEFKSNEWVEIVEDESDIPNSGHIEVKREGDKFIISGNGLLLYEYIHHAPLASGPFIIMFEGNLQIDNFSMTVP